MAERERSRDRAIDRKREKVLELRGAAWTECVLKQRKQEQSGRQRQSDRHTHTYTPILEYDTHIHASQIQTHKSYCLLFPSVFFSAEISELKVDKVYS